MSNRQWGHGYWRGVQDAQNGDVRGNIESASIYWIEWMKREKTGEVHSRLLYPVKDLSFWLIFVFGYEEEYVKAIYDYIMENEPLGCFITGQPYGKWIDDAFVLPIRVGEKIDKFRHTEECEQMLAKYKNDDLK